MEEQEQKPQRSMEVSTLQPASVLEGQKGALDFLWPDTPAPSSHFLLANTEEKKTDSGIVSSLLSNTSNRANLNNRLNPFSSNRSNSRWWHNPTNRPNLLHWWPPSKITHNTYKTNNNNMTSVSLGQHLPKTKKRTRYDTLPSKAMKGSSTEGRDKMSHASNKADSSSNIALSTLSMKVNKSSSNHLNLVGSDY